jgi:hypothetical protein
MKLLEMEIAVMRMLDVRNNIVVPNVSWGISAIIEGEYNCSYKRCKSLHECDILSLSKANFGTEYEIKTSKADLKADIKKKHGHDHPLIKRLFYAVPTKLVEYATEILPEDVGIVEVIKMETGDIYARVVRCSKNRPGFIAWDVSQKTKLMHLGCMRILGLKEKINRRK